MTLRIDAHQHFWRIDAAWHGWPAEDLPAIFRHFEPADLAPELQSCGIDGTVLVQSQPEARDTEWMLALAERTPFVLGVVGWADMRALDAAERIAALAARRKLKGLRPMLQDLPPEWILAGEAAPALEAMAAQRLVLDALVRPLHLEAIAVLADRWPALTIIVDHAAKPPVGAAWDERWAEGMALLARRPNVACKLSGLVTEAAGEWSAEMLRPFAAHVLACFGPERVLWGSDWPVVLLRSSYARWHEVAMELVPEQEREAVFGGNAARLYRLEGGVGEL